MISKKFRGTGVALVTAFLPDGTIDFPSMKRLIEHLIKNHADYLVVLGTTGESATLSEAEKESLVKFVIKIVDHRLPVVVGIGGNNTQNVVETIKSTDFEDIDAILSVAPYYNKPGQEGLYQHYKAIAEAAPVPVILYNVPGRTCSFIRAETTLRLANDFENIVAVKEASGDFDNIMKIIQHKPHDFIVVSGDDALTLPLIAAGVEGVISVIANVYPAQYSDIVRKALECDYTLARETHYALLDFIGALFEEGSPAGIKAALTHYGLINNNVLRMPLVPASEQLMQKIATLAQKIQPEIELHKK